MSFLEADLHQILPLLKQLSADERPLWGSMSAQRMVEHLSDTIDLSLGKINAKLELPEDKVERAQAFLASEHPMPRNFEVSFATKDTPVRNDDLDSAIQEFVEKWNEFEGYYKLNPDKTHLHPNFGILKKDQWTRIHRKHISHHLAQFGKTE